MGHTFGVRSKHDACNTEDKSTRELDEGHPLVSPQPPTPAQRHLVAQLATILHALGDAVCACSSSYAAISSSAAGNNTEGVGDDASTRTWTWTWTASLTGLLAHALRGAGTLHPPTSGARAPPDDVVLALVVRAAPPHKPGRSAPEPEGACGGAGIHRCAPSSSDLRFVVNLRILIVQAACTAPIAALGPAGRGGAWGARGGCTEWEGAELARRRTSTMFLAVSPPGSPSQRCNISQACLPDVLRTHAFSNLHALPPTCRSPRATPPSTAAIRRA
ncbi:hypothetical protein DFH09DRAFT_1327744 [Mycena vulgaris]|nr:hypothetical protein DFH09DRAFT_1327744 [Mycena vulgaris]